MMTERTPAIENAALFFDDLPFAVFITDRSGQPVYANHISFELLGKGIIPDITSDGLAEIYQAYLENTEQPYPTDRMPIVRALSGETSSVDDMLIRRPDGDILLKVWGCPIHDRQGAITHAIAVFLDITQQRQTERERDTLLTQQQRTIYELSTPVLKIIQGMLVLPLIGVIDSERASRIMERLLDAITVNQARVLIIDVTGVPEMAEEIANHLLLVTKSSHILGAQVILTGISPRAAQTLARLGLELTTMVTAGSLEKGLRLGMQMLGLHIVPVRDI